jgi:xanthine dehydrogenase YagR molybdenum-binding subunit
VAYWALEQAVDEMAHRLGKDPLALRRQWDDNPRRQQLYDWAETIPAWRERGPVGGETGRFRRGIGLAAANWFYFFHAATEIEVTTSPEGIMARTASQDIGNGTRTVIATAVAEVFGLDPTEIIVQIGDSQSVRGPLSGGSRTTNSVYYPAKQAAHQVLQQLVEEIQGQLNLAQVHLIPGGIAYGQEQLTWAEICRQVPPQRAVVGRGRDRGLPAMPLAFGADDQVTGRGFTGAVHISEVEVDTRLGKIKPLRVWGGLAAGRIIVPALARSQGYGGIIHGLGFALYEARQLDLQTGHNLTISLEDYQIPGIGDTPEIELHFIETGFEHAQGQGVGLAELANMAVAASVGNAVFHATGWRPYQLPIRPEQVISGVPS